MSSIQTTSKAAANPVRMPRSHTGPVTTSKDSTAPRPVSRQSSTGARKVLPQIPQSDGSSIVSSVTPSAANLPTGLSIGETHFKPFFLEYALMAEYNMIQCQKIPGVYVMPSAKSALVWNGVLFVRQGIYQDGVFRFTLDIPPTFPDCDCPSMTFTPPVFHPIIDPSTGSLDIVRAFHKWRRSVNHLWQLLLYARRIFFKIDTKEPMNAEAADLYENSPDTFRQRVVECVSRCRETLYDDPDPTDAHAIRFSPWDDSVHGTAKQQMLNSKTDRHSLTSNSAAAASLRCVKPSEPFPPHIAQNSLTSTTGGGGIVTTTTTDPSRSS